MSDMRRQKRKAVRESKRNLTTTKIDDDLAIALDGFLKDALWFPLQIKLCEKLNLEFPPNAKSGYELPIFNKHPITNVLEIHSSAVELFTSYQIFTKLSVLTVGMDTEDEEYKLISIFMGLILKAPSFGIYLHNLFTTSASKEKSFAQTFLDNEEEINERMQRIIAQI